jgi:hypothetical protein
LGRETVKAINPSRFGGDVGISGSFCRFGDSDSTAIAHVAQLVEHILGKDEVISSNLIMGSSFGLNRNKHIKLGNRNG